MNGQGTPQEVKMMKSHAEECGAAVTSRPWEMKTAATQTQVPSLRPKLLREEKAISRLLSHPLQNSPHSSKCFRHYTPCITTQTVWLLETGAENIIQLEQYNALNDLLILTLGPTHISQCLQRHGHLGVLYIDHQLNSWPPRRIWNYPEWLLKWIKISAQWALCIPTPGWLFNH